MRPVDEILDVTWPAKSMSVAGGFTLREGGDGIQRISCATLNGVFSDAEIDAAEQAQSQLGQPSLFMIRPYRGPDEMALDVALKRKGYRINDPVTVYHAPVARLLSRVPPVTAFAHWPPLQILREVWAANGVTPPRQAVMERTPVRKTAILGRLHDRAAGGAFVAIHQRTAMLHALITAPSFRRQGLARHVIAQAAHWASENGAEDFTLAVTRANPANSLYQSLGMREHCSYHYRLKAHV
ncbi:GNAT family N-acetyltransferase [Albirhodobacter sp. R86504]|uniref:GNAT family N-acetyltransferase n=1 Tax=Albirhodobacter sp. R86504 TaxID=3093848 RepID=UPI003671E665